MESMKAQEFKRGEAVMRVKDGFKMTCWGFNREDQTYHCSWYEGLDEKWGCFSKSSIRSCPSSSPTDGAKPDWRTERW